MIDYVLITYKCRNDRGDRVVKVKCLMLNPRITDSTPVLIFVIMFVLVKVSVHIPNSFKRKYKVISSKYM